MALGPAGYLPGWTGFLHNKVRKQANGQLRMLIAREATFEPLSQPAPVGSI